MSILNPKSINLNVARLHSTFFFQGRIKSKNVLFLRDRNLNRKKYVLPNSTSTQPIKITRHSKQRKCEVGYGSKTGITVGFMRWMQEDE